MLDGMPVCTAESSCRCTRQEMVAYRSYEKQVCQDWNSSDGAIGRFEIEAVQTSVLIIWPSCLVTVAPGRHGSSSRVTGVDFPEIHGSYAGSN
jgi:hypothetical protein